MLRQWVLRLSLLAACAIVSGCLEQAGLQKITPAKYIQSAELERQLIGNSLYRRGWTGAAKFQFASHHSPDGTMSAKSWWFGGAEQTVGRWRVTEDGLYCRTWNNFWAQGKEGCFSVAQSTEDGRLIFDHVDGHPGSHKRYIYQVLVGNPHRL